jgi:DNA-binding FadR family transcriptional regulator
MPRRSPQGAVFAPLPDMRGSIVKRTVKEQISDKLASHIASGILQVGDELPGERELAAAFSVSRESVRSAIQDLASRGLVEVSHGARTRVVRAEGAVREPGIANPRAVNSYDLRSVHGARLLAERAVVAESAERMDRETLDRLEASLAAQKHCLNDPVQFLICDREFHFAIYRCAANPLLSDFVMGLYTYLMEQRRTAVSQPGAILRSYRDHTDIMAGLRARDAAAVVAAFDRHLDRIYRTTRAILDAIGDPAEGLSRLNTLDQAGTDRGN